jgi:hypothetical protein
VTPPSAPPAPARRISIIGVTAFVVAVVGVLPSLLIFLLGLIPGWMDIYWLMFVVLPITMFVGAVAAVLGIVALILDLRARRSPVWSILALVVGAASLVAPLGLFSGWWS